MLTIELRNDFDDSRRDVVLVVLLRNPLNRFGLSFLYYCTAHQLELGFVGEFGGNMMVKHRQSKTFAIPLYFDIFT